MAFFQRKKFGARKQNAIPDGLWMKCDNCSQTVYKSEVESSLNTCPSCGHHYRMSARDRINATVDVGTFEETHSTLSAVDVLKFSVGKETYAERIDRAREQSGLHEALVTGLGMIGGYKVAIGVMDSNFIMASMVGEKLCRLVQDAITNNVPLVVFCASGGARMQEGTIALMQMAKTADAVRQLNEARLPYIAVLTDPTSGGVYASFASLGDIIVAEPDAYIGFAGARLIKGALKVKLPDGFQKAEYQFENGYVDEIVKRQEMKSYLTRLLKCLSPNPPVETSKPESELPTKVEPDGVPVGADANDNA
jgi:acetyl-CoA carboxylase carboxyl transferase subunit beta